MTTPRRKPSTVFSVLQAELRRLERFDIDNQRRLLPTGQNISMISTRQLQLLTEAIFFAAFRAYEQCVSELFILYCMGAVKTGRRRVVSFLNPRDSMHATQLIQSGMRHLDWTSPDIIIQRSETYLRDGYPFKDPYTVNLESLRDCKRIRNYIAHQSPESLEDYRKSLRKYYNTLPLTLPSPGQFLLLPEKDITAQYKLQTFIALFRDISARLV